MPLALSSGDLQGVLQLCDPSSSGFVSMEYFTQLARAHYRDQTEADKLVNKLDCRGRGFISYKEFCKAINSILRDSGSRDNIMMAPSVGQRDVTANNCGKSPMYMAAGDGHGETIDKNSRCSSISDGESYECYGQVDMDTSINNPNNSFEGTIRTTNGTNSLRRNTWLRTSLKRCSNNHENLPNRRWGSFRHTSGKRVGNNSFTSFDTGGSKEIKEENGKLFYKNAKLYWSKIPATVNEVLGGYGHLSKCDLESSRQFLQSLLLMSKFSPPNTKRCLDCGAGIGRVTKYLLLDFFTTVDLVEQNKLFLKKVRHYIGSTEKLGKLFCTGLQTFKPEKKYDVVWCQWVLGHLTDADLIKFLGNCRDSLEENGMIIIKDNVTFNGETDKETVDSSIIRGLNTFLDIFDKSQLKVIKLENQTKFPKELYPVKMIALRPKL